MRFRSRWPLAPLVRSLERTTDGDQRGRRDRAPSRNDDRRGAFAADPKTGARERSSIALVLVSAVCFAALGVLTQLAYRAGVSVLGLICGRYLIAAAALWVLVRVLRRPLPSRRGMLVGAVLGAGYSLQALLFAAALKRLEAGIADLLYFAYPAMVAVGATVIRRECWSRRRRRRPGGGGRRNRPCAARWQRDRSTSPWRWRWRRRSGYAARDRLLHASGRDRSPRPGGTTLHRGRGPTTCRRARPRRTHGARLGWTACCSWSPRRWLRPYSAASARSWRACGAWGRHARASSRRAGADRRPRLRRHLGDRLVVQMLGAGLVFASVPILEVRLRPGEPEQGAECRCAAADVVRCVRAHSSLIAQGDARGCGHFPQQVG